MLISKLVPFEEGVFIGGASSPMICLGRSLVEAGHSLLILAGSPEPKKEDSIREALSWATVHFVSMKDINPGRRGLQAGARMLLRAVQMCLRNDCHIIHSHAGYTYWGGLASLVGIVTRRPVVHTLYCPLTSAMNDKDRGLMSIQFARLSLLLTRHIIAISNNVYRSLIGAGIRQNRIAVIPPPIDDQHFNLRTKTTKMRQQLGLEADKHVLLFVGNLTKTKGLDVLLKAMQRLLTTYPQVRLIYTVERGPAITNEREKELRKVIANLHLGGKIIELGIVKNMPALMAACDVFVVPYRSTDGPSDYPIAMLEAMAVGRPIVATRVGGIPEIISDGRGGLLVAPDDPADLAGGIAALLEEPRKCKAMGETAARIVRARFTSGKIVRAVERVYLAGLRKKGANPLA